MLNKVILIGRTTQDIELAYTSQGIAYGRVSLAVDRKRGANAPRQTDFIQLVFWRGTAEFMKNYIKKGHLIYVEGELHINQFTNRDNQVIKSTEVTVMEIKLLTPKSSTTQRVDSDAVFRAPEQPRSSYFPQPQNNSQAQLQNRQSNSQTSQLHEIDELSYSEDNSGLFETDDN